MACHRWKRVSSPGDTCERRQRCEALLDKSAGQYTPREHCRHKLAKVCLEETAPRFTDWATQRLATPRVHATRLHIPKLTCSPLALCHRHFGVEDFR